MKSYQRSFRLDPDLQDKMQALPLGTANNLVNNLLWLYFSDPQMQKEIDLHDRRSKKTAETPKTTEVLPGQTAIDEIMPGY